MSSMTSDTLEARAMKLETIAEKLEALAEQGMRDRRENTPKQRCQASSARYDAHNNAQAAKAANALADAIRNGTADESLVKKYSAATAITAAVKCRMSRQSHGFNNLIFPIADEFYDESPEAVALRTLAFDGDNIGPDPELELKQALAKVRGARLNGFFPTPDSVIEIMLDGIMTDEPCNILEPSAGIGSIADFVKDKDPVCVEQSPQLCEILRMKGHTVLQGDFLEIEPQPAFDLVLMNPPFEKDQWIDHVQHALKFLNEEGELVAVLPSVAEKCNGASTKKRQGFSYWLEGMFHEFRPVPEGAFKSAFNPTGVSTVVLEIRP